MLIQFHVSIESDSIFPGQRLSGNQTLVSYGQIFEMGFFSPSGSELDKHGNLSLYTSTGHAVWSTNSSFSLGPLDSIAANLREDGNFIISRGIKRVLKSWLATSNPSTGNFSAETFTRMFCFHMATHTILQDMC
ncbi:hypothetical protein AAHE18_03G122900 [Arachis hypogaea]